MRYPRLESGSISPMQPLDMVLSWASCYFEVAYDFKDLYHLLQQRGLIPVMFSCCVQARHGKKEDLLPVSCMGKLVHSFGPGLYRSRSRQSQ